MIDGLSVRCCYRVSELQSNKQCKEAPLTKNISFAPLISTKKTESFTGSESKSPVVIGACNLDTVMHIQSDEIKV